jgi:hypothetical protein
MTYTFSKILMSKYPSKAIMWKNGSMGGASEEIIVRNGGPAYGPVGISKVCKLHCYLMIAIYQKTHKRKAIWIYYSLIVFITIELTEFRRSRFDPLSTSRNKISSFHCLTTEL